MVELPEFSVKGADLRAMRLVSEKTTKTMAIAAGVRTRKTYENWEKDIGSPSVNQFFALVKECGMTPVQALSIMSSENKASAYLRHIKSTF